jgi:hypothetical protein
MAEDHPIKTDRLFLMPKLDQEKSDEDHLPKTLTKQKAEVKEKKLDNPFYNWLNGI